MNCDQVFDVLTRGPFPSGSPDDAPAERHLAGCASCRRLADALRPAVELLHESLAMERTVDLPGYWGELFEADREPAQVATISPATRASAPPNETSSRTNSRSRPLRRWASRWQVVAAVFAGALIAAVLLRGQHDPNAASGLGARADSGRLELAQLMERVRPCQSGGALLAALGEEPVNVPPTASRPDSAPSSPTLAASSHAATRQDCCLQCHAPAKPLHLNADSLSRLQESCLACHQRTVDTTF